MELQKARAEFNRIQERAKAINHAVSLIFFDGETAAPSNTADNRIRAVETLNATLYNLKYGSKTVELVDFLSEHEEELSFIERRSLNLLRRDINTTRNIPRKKYVGYENLLISARDAWHKAIDNQNYTFFEPYLEKIFHEVSELSTYGKSGMGPYDYCLNLYEPGTNVSFYDEIMDVIRAEVVPLFHELINKPKPSDDCLRGDFSVEKQEELALYILDMLGVDSDHVSLATSEHPFIRTMGSHLDIRVTTKYMRRDYTKSLYTLLYSCGHVLCASGQDDAIAYTFADDSIYTGLMMSQTYFYESVLGKSRAFIESIYPKLKELFPDPVANYTPEDIYLAVNKVEAGPIRIGSDEVSNNLHLLIRYELEKALFDRSLSARDLPDAWAEKYKEYLGVEVSDPLQGVLQDLHWAHGSIGIFPGMILGECYAALIYDKMSREVDILKGIREKDFTELNRWNKENIWSKAGLYDTVDLIKQITDEPVNANAYIKYLKHKYSNF